MWRQTMSMRKKIMMRTMTRQKEAKRYDARTYGDAMQNDMRKR